MQCEQRDWNVRVDHYTLGKRYKPWRIPNCKLNFSKTLISKECRGHELVMNLILENKSLSEHIIWVPNSLVNIWCKWFRKFIQTIFGSRQIVYLWWFYNSLRLTSEVIELIETDSSVWSVVQNHSSFIIILNCPWLKLFHGFQRGFDS